MVFLFVIAFMCKYHHCDYIIQYVQSKNEHKWMFNVLNYFTFTVKVGAVTTSDK